MQSDVSCPDFEPQYELVQQRSALELFTTWGRFGVLGEVEVAMMSAGQGCFAVLAKCL